jgi:Zn-dependent M16 (insulinase) family peptidase
MFGQATRTDLGKLTKGTVLKGFRVDSIYLDANDKPFGGRFVHARTGFVLDLLQIQSVPQAYIYANTFTVSDMGEPHTQEHLLILKGNKGRNIAVNENMSLTQSNASTYQTYTDYTYNTAGGTEVFFDRFANYMDVLLHPDYTSEEVAREVRNWGVTEGPDGKLTIEEKGSVYNEMMSSMYQPDWRGYDRMLRLLYGDKHPLSFNAGGAPEGIRLMVDADIKRYHDANYHLGNMGALVSVPKETDAAHVLEKLDAIFATAEPGKSNRKFPTLSDLPSPTPAPAGKIAIVDYPSENPQQPSSIQLGMPATLKLDVTERILMQAFLAVFAGDSNTNLYKKFVDGKSRTVDTGAKGVGASLLDSPGDPVFLFLTDVPAQNLTMDMAKKVQESVHEELVRIASFKDGSPELKEFNDRFRNALIDNRRGLSKFISTPPGFGFRSGGNGDTWLWLTRYLNDEEGFKKSVILKPQMAKVDQLLASGKNFWADYLKKWGYTTAVPYVTVTRPEPKLIGQEEADKKIRVAAEIENLKKKFQTSDDQEAIRRYKAQYDAVTLELEKLEQAATAKFIPNPPLTLDDQIDYTETKVGGMTVGSARFDNMTGATTGIAMRLNSVPESDLVYASALPQLLRNTGVIKDGKAVTYEDMSEMLRQEILSLNLTFSSSGVTDRYELVARGAGNDPAESERAVGWMKLMLTNPNWTAANLPRMRDVVDQQFSALQRRMQDSEETWVTNPSDAYLYQDRPLYLATNSFFTQAHNFFRLRWMLKDRGDAASAKAIDKFFGTLAAAGKGNSRDSLVSVLKELQNATPSASREMSGSFGPLYSEFDQLPPAARAIAVDAAKDLALLVNDLPDSSLASDWQYLCEQMRGDLAQGPTATIAKLNAVRSALLNTNSSRLFYIGSADTKRRLDPSFSTLVADFSKTSPANVSYSKSRAIDSRINQRTASTERPVYVGLLAPNMSGGVIINSAPVAGYRDKDRDKILDYLAAKLYGGYGSQAVFTKTVAAGLAYSNGISNSPENGRMRYYAERTPLIPQTLGFVVTEVKRPFDADLGDYVTALSFNSRASAPYETRGEAMANDMADGRTPDVVRAFRRAILEARQIPDLSKQLFARKDRIYERVLPGYGAKGREISGASFFSIGPEKQLSAYEEYLKKAEGADTKFYRLYPRDFWITAK